MIDIQQLTSLISAFCVETEKESISPETVGSILQAIADLLGVIDTWALRAAPKALPLCADGRFFEVGLSQSFLEYGLWQDNGTGRETPRATVAILAEPRNANAANGSPASITPQSCDLKNSTRRTLAGRSVGY